MHRAGRLAAIGWLLTAFLVAWMVASMVAGGTVTAGRVPQITVGHQVGPLDR